MSVHVRALHSPLGQLLLSVDDDGQLVRIDLPGAPGPATVKLHQKGDCCTTVATQLAGYFAGERQTFDLPLAPTGTPFQLLAWSALRQIPFGQTRSYQDQALAIGKPRAVRAVGGANGRNPIPIVVPCHRVVGKDGSLVGFGGGLPSKRWLLDHEAAVLARCTRPVRA